MNFTHQKGRIGGCDCSVGFDERCLQLAHLFNGGWSDSIIFDHCVSHTCKQQRKDLNRFDKNILLPAKIPQFKAFLYIPLIENTTLYQQPDKHIYLELCMVGHRTVVLSQKPSGPWNVTSRHTHPVIQNRKSIIQVHVRN